MSVITIWDLGVPVARTGIPARTQRIDSFDSGSRTYVGNKSRAVITRLIDAGQVNLSGNYVFLVTPDVGDIYRFYQSDERMVTPGETVVINLEYPWIVAADVYLETVEFNAFQSVNDNFESYSLSDYTSLPGTSTWQATGEFNSTPPNGDAWDGLDDYNLGGLTVSSILLSLNTGYGWVEPGIFNGTDNLECSDDLEGYPVGAIFMLNQGAGWAGLGMLNTSFEYQADDDLEGYPVGIITSLDGGTGNWTSAGEFG